MWNYLESHRPTKVLPNLCQFVSQTRVPNKIHCSWNRNFERWKIPCSASSSYSSRITSIVLCCFSLKIESDWDSPTSQTDYLAADSPNSSGETQGAAPKNNTLGEYGGQQSGGQSPPSVAGKCRWKPKVKRVAFRMFSWSNAAAWSVCCGNLLIKSGKIRTVTARYQHSKQRIF